MKTKRIFEIIISFLLCSYGFMVNAQQTGVPAINSFSAKQAVDYALKNAVQVKNALVDIQLQRQVNKEVTAAALASNYGKRQLKL